jgi:hypothetical protein
MIFIPPLFEARDTAKINKTVAVPTMSLWRPRDA